MPHPWPPWQTLRANKLSLGQGKVLIQRIQPILRERLALAISDCLTVMRGRLVRAAAALSSGAKLRYGGISSAGGATVGFRGSFATRYTPSFRFCLISSASLRRLSSSAFASPMYCATVCERPSNS